MACKHRSLAMAAGMAALVSAAMFAGAAMLVGCKPPETEPAQALPGQTEQVRVQSKGEEFFGVGGVSQKIVYVIDRSGSMTDSIMYVKHELKRSIRMLRPNQMFHVIFFSSGPAVEMPARKILPATEANKLAAYEFIDGVVPVGQTDPAEAIKLAFGVEPDIIYILTDGEFGKEIPGLVARLNRDKKVSVNTICFVYRGGEAMLKQIAQENNGTFSYVGEDDLENLGK